MGDLTIETAAVCATNVEWSTEVVGSKGDIYTVRFCHQPQGRVQYDYECTCWAFKAKRARCKHIQQVVTQRLRCAWNDAMDPGLSPDGNKCPSCGGPLHYMRVGV
jgi:hypothetical protein